MANVIPPSGNVCHLALIGIALTVVVKHSSVELVKGAVIMIMIAFLDYHVELTTVTDLTQNFPHMQTAVRLIKNFYDLLPLV